MGWRQISTIMAMASLAGGSAKAQLAQQDPQPRIVSVDRIPQEGRDNGASAPPNASPAPAPAHALGQAADGRRRGDLPLEAYAVVPGTRVLVGLEDTLDTGEIKPGRQFRARTLEPMEAGSGIYLPAGWRVAGN